MKKISLYLMIISLIFVPKVSKAVVTSGSDFNNLTVYLFCDDSDECKSEYDDLEEYLKDQSEIKVSLMDTSNELYNTVKDELNIKKNTLPLTIIGTTYFYGYNDKNKDKIKEAIEKYHDSKYCDAIMYIQNKQDMKDCLNQNKGIYDNETLPWGIIIGVSLVFVVALGGVIIYFNKKN